ncbi:MAG: HepT-like ribonuclease domain-containing protein [Thermomicrobiales bacterium]
MKQESEEQLLETLYYCEAIAGFIEHETHDSFREILLLQLGIQKAMENIGEALGRVRKNDPGVAAKIYEVHRFVAIRNDIVHEYDGVGLGIVWRVVTEEVPNLMASIIAILADERVEDQ